MIGQRLHNTKTGVDGVVVDQVVVDGELRQDGPSVLPTWIFLVAVDGTYAFESWPHVDVVLVPSWPKLEPTRAPGSGVVESR